MAPERSWSAASKSSTTGSIRSVRSFSSACVCPARTAPALSRPPRRGRAREWRRARWGPAWTSRKRLSPMKSPRDRRVSCRPPRDTLTELRRGRPQSPCQQQVGAGRGCRAGEKGMAGTDPWPKREGGSASCGFGRCMARSAGCTNPSEFSRAAEQGETLRGSETHAAPSPAQ